MLDGGKGSDILAGGAGNDMIGLGFRDSKPGAPDILLEFPAGDRIDLSAIDAKAGVAGDQAFDFISGELRYGTDGRLKADLDGDGRADFIVIVVGARSLDRGVFIL